MKKILGLAALLCLTACSSGGVDDDSLKTVDRALNVKHVCLKGSTRGAPDLFVENLKTSLSKKNITSEMILNAKDIANCEHVLAFSVKGNRNIVAKAKLRLTDVSNKNTTGLVSYKRKGDEKDRVEQTGLQGQTDSMISQLFKNY